MVARELQKSATISFSSPNFHPDKASNFAWIRDAVVYQGENVSMRPESMPLIKRSLLTQLAEKNYRFGMHKDKAQYLCQAVVIVGNALHQADMDELFGLDPQLGGSNVKYERGTLVLMIAERSGKIVWRGAVQIFTDPSSDLSVAKYRVDNAIGNLTSALPDIR